MNQKLKIKSVSNFRDFTYLKNKNNLSIKDGLFFRCGKLMSLTEKDSKKLQELGIKYIIDLRSNVEVREEPDKNLGDMIYYHMPLLTAEMAGITQDTASIQILLDHLPSMQEVYKRMCDDSAVEQIKKILDFIMNADGGVAFHCTAGKDRTGIIAMLLLYILDFNMDDIIDNYLLTNKYTKSFMILATIGIFLKTWKISFAKTINKLFVVDKSYMDSFLDEVNKKYGSLDLFIKNGLDIDEDKKAKFKQKVLI